LNRRASASFLRDCSCHQHEGKEWISLPGHPYQGSDGIQRWQPIVEFAEGARETRRQFQEKALESIHAIAKAEAER
jgi:hypothetical protein